MSVSGPKFLEDLESRLNTLQGLLEEEEADFFPEWILPLAKPDPKDLDSTIQAFARAGLMLGSDAPYSESAIETGALESYKDMLEAVPEDTTVSLIDSIVESDGISTWRGDARDAFRDDFIKFYREDGETARKQRLLCIFLLMAAQAERELYIRTRTDISDAVDKAIVRIESIAGDLSGPEDFVMPVTIVGAVATIAALKGGGIEIAGTIIAAGSSVAASAFGAKDEPKVEFTFKAQTAIELTEELTDFTFQLESYFMDEGMKISKSLAELADIMTGPQRKSLVGPTVGHDEPGDKSYSSPLENDKDGDTYVDDDYLEGFKPK